MKLFPEIIGRREISELSLQLDGVHPTLESVPHRAATHAAHRESVWHSLR